MNGHTHAAMTLFRGFGDDLPLMEWLEQRIWPAEARLTGDDVYWGTRLACLEMIRTGTIRFWDMYWHQLDVARAVLDSGMRATVGQPILEFDGAPDGARPEAAADGIAALGALGPRVHGALTPHAHYSVTEPSLRLIAEISDDQQVPVHTHLSETEQEVDDCLAAHGCRPAALPRPARTAQRADGARARRLARRGRARARGRARRDHRHEPGVEHEARGRARVPVPAGARGRSGRGTRHRRRRSNNSLDLLADMKVLALLQKHTSVDPSTVPAAEAWSIATGELAPVLGGTPVAVGQPADFLLVDRDGIEMTCGPLVESLVYATSSAAVDTVVVDGHVLMRHRRIEGEAEVRARALEASRRACT